MKSHIRITVEQELVDELKRVSREERRSLDNLLELAARNYLENKRGRSGSFEGTPSRAETYRER